MDSFHPSQVFSTKVNLDFKKKWNHGVKKPRQTTKTATFQEKEITFVIYVELYLNTLLYRNEAFFCFLTPETA